MYSACSRSLVVVLIEVTCRKIKRAKLAQESMSNSLINYVPTGIRVYMVLHLYDRNSCCCLGNVKEKPFNFLIIVKLLSIMSCFGTSFG